MATYYKIWGKEPSKLGDGIVRLLHSIPQGSESPAEMEEVMKDAIENEKRRGVTELRWERVEE
jgi:hypothetical protein